VEFTSMTLISVLASPPSALSPRARAAGLNRFTRIGAVMAGLFGARAWPQPSFSPDGPRAAQSAAPRTNDDDAPDRASRPPINEPLRSGAAPGLRNARPATRIAIGPSAVVWSGEI
jgi:hypothetical protein